MRNKSIFAIIMVLPALILMLGSPAFSKGKPAFISLSPTSLSFTATVGGSNPAAQTVTVSNSGGGTLATPTTSISYGSGSGWLTVTVSGSSAPYTLTNQPSISGLAAGTYTATVSVSSSGAKNSPQSYSVTLTLSGSQSPAISLSPTSLSFNATAGGSNPASQDVTVSNSGGGTLATPTTSISYGSGSGWLSATVSGSSAPYTVTNQPSISGLSAGTYTATVSVSSSGASNSPQTYSVTLTVSPASAAQCTTSSNSGICGPYGDTEVTDNAGGNSNVQNDVWNPISGASQTLYTVSEGRWWVTANIPSGNTAVVSYPDTDILFSNIAGGNPTIDSYSYMYSSWTDTTPDNSGTILDNGYDMWFNNYGNEVMIQTRIENRPVCTNYMTVLATNVSFGGSNGVPVNSWNLCRNGGAGSELIWQWIPPNGSSTDFGIDSGTVDIYNMLKYLENNGYLPSGSTITAIQFGMELSSTGGVNENFYMDLFSLTASQ